MAQQSQKQPRLEAIPHGLVVIARDVTDQIVTRITSHRDLVGAIHTARSVLLLKPGAVRVEVHHGERLTSNYDGTPLAVVSHEDLYVDQCQPDAGWIE
jgi:hypothetical protein